MFNSITITHLRYLQQDINILARTKQDDEKLSELRHKRDVLLRGRRAVKSKPDYRITEDSHV